MRALFPIATVLSLVVLICGGIAGSFWMHRIGAGVTNIILVWVGIALAVIVLGLSWISYEKNPPLACIFCGFNLTGRSENLCPKCGRHFDPPSSSNTTLIGRFPMSTWILIARTLSLVIFVGGGLAGSIWMYSLNVGFLFMMIYWAINGFGVLTVVLTWNYPKKNEPNTCHYCGYNLTGLVENRCPECGHYFVPSTGDSKE